MFKFLKNKIQEAVKKFSKSSDKVEEEVETEKFVEETQDQPQAPQEESQPVEEIQEDSSDENLDKSEVKPEEVIDETPKEISEEITEDIDEVQEESRDNSEDTNDDLGEIFELEGDQERIDKEPIADEVQDVQEEPPIGEPEVIEMTEPQVEEVPKEDVIEEVPESIKELTEEETEVPILKEQEEAQKLDELFVDEAEETQPVNEPETPSIETEPEQVDELEVQEEPFVEDLPENIEQEEPQKKKGFFNRLFGGKKEEKLSEPEITPEELAEDVAQDIPEPIAQAQEPIEGSLEKHQTDLLDEEVKDATKKKKGFFEKIKERVTKFQLTEEKFEEVFWDFELALMENNVALEVIEKVKHDMHEQLTKENVTRKSVDQVILDTLKSSLEDVLTVEQFNFLEKIQSKKPYVITMVGVNGSGKTTTLAKIINLLQKNNLSVVVAASDTFRAAAIQQLEEHTTKLGVKLIKHDYNADPSAVAYDAISHAKAKDIDVVLIDTAGRLQSNSNLMDELKKLIRVNKPDLNIFIGESVTGNDCVEQAVAFNEAVGIDGIVLSKADIDEKGGAAISVSYVTKKPILYIGTGQTYDDLKAFNKDEILANLGL